MMEGQTAKPELATQLPNELGSQTVVVKRTALSPGNFSVSARVAMQLGRESISSSNTAIVELVKNAYDADADLVSIRFSGLNTSEAKMVIEDDGHGMNESELRDHWLCIGTNNKQQNGKSPKKGRVQTGEKGLGRLGLDRLCSRAVVQTLRKQDSDEGALPEMFPDTKRSAVELDIVWGRYEEAAGARLENIQHSVSALEHLDFDPLTLTRKTFPHGTRLILEGLKDNWTRERLNELADELSLLLSPFGRPENFTIQLDSGEGWDDVDGVVHAPDSLLELANWKVEATIEPSSNKAGATYPDIGENVVIKMTSPRHERAYLPQPTSWADFTKHKGTIESSRVSRCGPLRFEFYVFIRDSGELERRGSGLAEVTEFLASNRGIRIYRDGFRVKPFGDPAGQHDWLSLSLRRATNPAGISRDNWKVAYHQVVGAVFVSREANKELIDQTNREGIVEGAGFDDMRLFAEKVVQYFEGRAHEDSVTFNPRPTKPPPPQKPPRVKALEALGDIGDAVKKLEAESKKDGEVSSARLIADAIPKALAAVENMQAEREEERKQYEEEVAELRDEMVLMTSLASLGIMTASFGHERVNDATEVLNDAARLRKHIRDPQQSLFTTEERLEMLDHLIAGAERVDAFAKFALDHVRPRKRHRQAVDLKATLTATLKVFNELICERYRAKVEADMPENGQLWVSGWEAGWESVLVNFITNSCWALGRKKADERHVRVTILDEPPDVVLIFEDSGVNLEAGTETDIFRPGVSTKRDEHNRPIGTGMGLAIINSFVTRNRGTVKAFTDSSLGGAKFVIRVPRVATPT